MSSLVDDFIASVNQSDVTQEVKDSLIGFAEDAREDEKKMEFLREFISDRKNRNGIMLDDIEPGEIFDMFCDAYDA